MPARNEQWFNRVIDGLTRQQDRLAEKIEILRQDLTNHMDEGVQAIRSEFITKIREDIEETRSVIAGHHKAITERVEKLDENIRRADRLWRIVGGAMAFLLAAAVAYVAHGR
jgi:archaellum component FlaC